MASFLLCNELMNQIKCTLILILAGSLAQAQKVAPRVKSVSAYRVGSNSVTNARQATARKVIVAKHSIQYVKPDLSVGKARRSKAMNYTVNEQSILNSSSAQISADTSEKETVNRFGLTAQVGYSSALYDRQDGLRQQSYDFLLAPRFRMSSTYSLSGILTGSTDAEKREGSDFGTARIALSRSPWIYKLDENILKAWNFSPSVTLSVPANKDTRENQSLLTGLGMGISISPNPSLLGSERFSTVLSLSATRNIHTYEIAKSGASNSQYSSAQSLSMSYLFLKVMTIEVAASHYNSWTYEANAKEFWGHSQDLSGRVSENVSLAIGHQFGSPAVSIYRADGSSLNLGLISEQYSYYYTNLTATF